MKLPGALSRLDEDQHTYLISLLSLGKTDGEITNAIHEKGWLDDVKRPTLLKNVNRWRRGKGQEALMKHLADTFQQSPGKMKRQIDTLEEMTQLVLAQKKRLERAMKNEDDKPLLLGMVSSELTRLTGMLEKLAKLQMDVGLIRKVKPGEVEGDYIDNVEEEETHEQVFSEEDRRLLRVINRASGSGEIVQ